MAPKPQNIKIIFAGLPIIDAKEYVILFSYTYEISNYPFYCERVLKVEALIEHIEKQTSKKPKSPIFELASPNDLLIYDVMLYGIPNGEPFKLDSATAFALSSENEKQKDIPEALRLLSRLINEFNATLVYRGESRLFGLNGRVKQPIPKIFRKGEHRNFLFALREAFMFNDYQHQVQEASFSTNFQWLADMQHFGMPTRLLDVTNNVLTALYFACQEDNYDGALFSYSANTPYIKILEDFIKNFWCDISLIADLAQVKPFLERKLIEHLKIKVEFPARVKFSRPQIELPELKFNWISERILIRDMDESYQKDFEKFIRDNLDAVFEMIADVYVYCPLYITPPAYLNQRIVNQSGGFLLFPGKICFDDNDRLINPLALRNLTRAGRVDFNAVFIPSEWKQKFRRLLYDKFNVNEGTIYPDKEHIVNSIVNRGF